MYLSQISYIFHIYGTGRHHLKPDMANTWCDYEAPGMILLCDLKGAIQLDCSENMSVHVSTCTTYDFSALMPVVWKLC
jgi:hypothetical protein